MRWMARPNTEENEKTEEKEAEYTESMGDQILDDCAPSSFQQFMIADLLLGQSFK